MKKSLFAVFVIALLASCTQSRMIAEKKNNTKDTAVEAAPSLTGGDIDWMKWESGNWETHGQPNYMP